ncbi:ANTAR domain-containing response regulator [Thiomicrorhabdus lithotrophica]|uniref:ANTAR domain-containing protein n=1 Tax=Thiomicrorhabdus lithotrophica TaxID=2949997 RepID=A0ABY8CCE3_9GAMM|nr:ANTAR domain-containing protein [Thiomicrorhabdus lithotrophica]WEJ63666.1 ANTAR domain-containing protein [Thiomicrorhabdus lithotrophica]
MQPAFSVLLISDDLAGTGSIQEGLVDSGASQVYKCSSDDNFLQQLDSVHVDLIVLDIDKPTVELFEQFSLVRDFCPKPVVCFSNDSDSKLIEKSVQAGVAAYIVDGKAVERVKPIIEVAIMRFNECQAVRKELASVKDKLSERAVIEKAKGLLIEHKNMTEDGAYKTLRKMAMDQGKKISVVAHEVCGVLVGLEGS